MARKSAGKALDRYNDQRHTEAQVRVQQAIQMRIEGATYTQIADRLGYYNRQHAWRAVSQEMANRKGAGLDELREVEVERLDKMYLALSKGRRNGDIQAINTSIRISERRSKLLGLDDYESRMAAVEEQRVALEAAEAERLFACMVRALQRLGLSTDQQQRFKPLLLEEMALIEMDVPATGDGAAGQLQLPPAADADLEEPDADRPPQRQARRRRPAGQ